jgi:hypothetical protein
MDTEMDTEMDIEMDQDWATVDACTLPTVERPLRAAEFDALFAEHLASVETPDEARARLVFEGPVGLQTRVQDLTDRETQCCSFFAFTVRATRGDHGRESVTLDVEVPGARTDALAAMVARARGRASVRPT